MVLLLSVVVLALAAQAQDVLTLWNHSNKSFCFKRAVDETVTNCTADTLIPNSWLATNVFRIDQNNGSPQYFTLFLDVEGFGASQGNPTITVLAMTAGRADVRGYADWSGGDSTYFVTAATAIDELCRLQVEVPIKGGDYAQLWFWNSGDTVSVNVDSSFVWMKH